jgi:endonuclease/exonuclease/phosphatase family metal-dependent hydrolase
LILALVVGLALAWGADRRPADATRPIVWRDPTTAPSPRTGALRIASFNIHGGKGADGQLDLARIAVELEGVDLAALFEVRASRWQTFPDQAAELGERLGLRSAYLGTERRWWHEHFGNAVLSAVPIAGVQRIPLVNTRGKAFRQAALVEVPLADATVHILMVHVDRERDRQHQLDAVIRLFESLATPAVLMGDLNTPRDDPRLKALLESPGVKSAVENPPAEAIDWILVRGLDCSGVEVRDGSASDHPALRATLRLSP